MSNSTAKIVWGMRTPDDKYEVFISSTSGKDRLIAICSNLAHAQFITFACNEFMERGNPAPMDTEYESYNPIAEDSMKEFTQKRIEAITHVLSVALLHPLGSKDAIAIVPDIIARDPATSKLAELEAEIERIRKLGAEHYYKMINYHADKERLEALLAQIKAIDEDKAVEEMARALYNTIDGTRVIPFEQSMEVRLRCMWQAKAALHASPYYKLVKMMGDR